MSTPFEPIKPADSYLFDANALEESRQIFIDGNQLLPRWQALSSTKTHQFVIAETRFGCGLNFLLTWSLWQQYAPPTAQLHFMSCATHPLRRDDLAQCLTLWPQLQEQACQLLAVYPVLTPGFHTLQFTADRVTLTLMLGDVLACYRELLVCGDEALERQLRAWYVDAWFVEEVAPAIESDSLYTLMHRLSTPTTTVAIHTMDRNAKNQYVFNLPVSCRRVERHTPWSIHTPQTPRTQNAIILGAGLAGCYTAYALARRGFQVTLVDAHAQVGSGASGNQHAVLYPKLSYYRSPLTEFMLSAFLFAARTYKNLLIGQSFGELNGIFQLPYRHAEQLIHASLVPWLKLYPELGRLVDAHEASEHVGIALQSGGLLIPSAGWMDSAALCQFLMQNPGIQWQPDTHVSQLDYGDGLWHVADLRAEIVVIANGYQAHQFKQTAHLPIKAMHGQMTTIKASPQSAALRIPLCGDAHILPMRAGMHGLGATYNPTRMNNRCDAYDDAINLAHLTALPTEAIWSLDIKENWAGVRGATPDYLPLVGPVADEGAFKERFAGLASNSKRWIPREGAYYPGLYVCAGFGSRGLTTIPMCAEYLAALIHQAPIGIPRTLLQAVAPARFLRREIVRGR